MEMRVAILSKQIKSNEYLPDKKFALTEEYREAAVKIIEKDFNSKINKQMTDKICQLVGITTQVFIDSRDDLAIQNL